MNLDTSRSWANKRLRFLISRGRQNDRQALKDQDTEVPFLPMEAIGEHGQLDLSKSRPIEEVRTGYTQFHNGDVVVAKITPCFENGKGALIQRLPQGIGFGTTELYVLTPTHELDGKYLYYITIDPRFRKLGEACMTGAAGQQRVPEDFVRDFRILFPTLRQQRAIADYLDLETARIDALIAAKERLLELLAEKRRALITRAVTRGLDPSAPLRATGVEWIPNIPKHWRESRIRRLFRQTKQLCFPDLPILSVYREYGVIERMSRDDNSNRIPDDREKYQLVEQGDLVINKMKAWQGSLGISDYRGITSPDYVVFRPEQAENSAFLHFLLRMQMLTTVYLSISNGIRINQWRIEPERFVDLPIFLPPIAEQKKIVKYIVETTTRIDNLFNATERTIGLFKERRTALIAAAVTGQIDVGGGP